MTTKADKIRLLDGSLKDPVFFFENCFKIRDKSQQLVPLLLNPVQRAVHAALEKQKRETGKVRAIILKARRMGCSTLIAARFYRHATLEQGVSVAIVAHVQKTTGNLYRIVKRANEHNPIAPNVGASNIRELVFDRLDSRYSVFSAESTEIGRGEDVTHLHFSEAGMYAKLEDHRAGIGECVPDRPGTEIILESTAKYPFGEFYDMCQDAIAGIGEYQFIFMPWTKDPDNYRPAPPDFEPESARMDEGFPSEVELMEQFGVTSGQLVWRRAKMGSARNFYRFMKEYPLTPEEAFSAQSDSALINPADVIRARKAKVSSSGAKVIGVDPAGAGTDRFAIACRQGNTVKWVQTRNKVSFNEAIAWIKAVIEDEGPEAVFIDAGGGGNGSAICSALSEDPTTSRLVRPVNFGGRSQTKLARPDKPGPANRRSEMWGRLAKWLSGEAAVDIPDEDAVSKDLAMARIKEMPNGDWRLESKEGAVSPDIGDAIALTFANRHISKSEQVVVKDGHIEFNYGGPQIDRPRSWMV